MREHIAIRLLPIISLLLLGGASTAVPVKALEAVLVYDYGFANQATGGEVHTVLNKTSSFTQDTRFVIGYVSAALYAANLTAQWYDPSGQLYYNQTYQEECVSSPCTFLFYLPVAYNPAAIRLGLWRMDLLAAGFKLYSAYFWIRPVIIEDDYWNFNVVQSAPPRLHGDLTVILHPDNQTWSSYSRYIPYAANLTAHDATTKRTLDLISYNYPTTHVVVKLGGARSDGYTFVLSFDLNSSVVLWSLNGWYGGSFAFGWQDAPWERATCNACWQRNVHPTPETFNVTLPKATTLLDIAGSNVMTLDYNVTGVEKTSISFSRTTPPEQGIGWTITYQDFSYRNSNPPPPQPPGLAGLNVALGQPLPVLPLTLGGLSIWTALMSVFLLIGSELILPVYVSQGVFDRRRLRVAALILVAIFIGVTVYQLLISSRPLPTR